MLEYHAAYYPIEDGWYMAKVLDFPGVVTQGKNLKAAKRMLRSALQDMASWYLEDGQPLPQPSRKTRDKKAECVETIRLVVRAMRGGCLMKRQRLLKHLREQGCEILKEGGNHTWIHNQNTGHKSFIPRHREIKPALVREICKQLQVSAPKGK